MRGNDPATVNLAHALAFDRAARTDRVALPQGVEHPESECPGILAAPPTGGDRRALGTSPVEVAVGELPGGKFHDVWLKARANGFFR